MSVNSNRRPSRAGVVAALGLALAGVSLSAAAGTGPSLGAAQSFAVLGGSTVASSGLTSVTGDVGVSPGTAIVGFPPGTITSGALHAGDVAAAEAHADAEIAYTYLAGMASLPANNLTGTDLGGLTLAPGVYKFNTSAQLTGDLVLDAQGDSGALFVVQIGSTLTTSSNASVVVINGGADYDESNIFWQVGSSATLGTGTAFTGNILAYGSITLVSGASMTGNALALVGAVTLDANTVTTPAPVSPPPPIPGVPTAPTNLTVAPIAGAPPTGADVSWTDASDDESEFRIFRRDGAGPSFVFVGSVSSQNVAGTGSRVTYRDPVFNPSTVYAYRVTASGTGIGESVPSNTARIDLRDAFPPVVVPPARWMDIHLGRARSTLWDRKRVNRDIVSVKGSYAVIDVDSSVPTVLDGGDPRNDIVRIRLGAPEDVVVITIPAHDPNWRENQPGIYRWRSNDGRGNPVTTVMIDTRRSEFTLRSNNNEFAVVPVNSISVSFSGFGATGSETRAWTEQSPPAPGTRALFTTAK